MDELLASSLPDQILDSFSSRRRPSLSGEDGGLSRHGSFAGEGGAGEEGGEDEPLLKRESGAEEREKSKERRETLMLNGKYTSRAGYGHTEGYMIR